MTANAQALSTCPTPIRAPKMLENHFGSSDTEINTLTTTTDLGFTKNFAAGGQLMFDIVNSFIFTFSGGGDHLFVFCDTAIETAQRELHIFGEANGDNGFRAPDGAVLPAGLARTHRVHGDVDLARSADPELRDRPDQPGPSQRRRLHPDS